MITRLLFSYFLFVLTLTLSAQHTPPLIEYHDGNLVGLSDEKGKIHIRPRFASIKGFGSGKRMKQYRQVCGFDGSVGAVDILTDSLVVPLRRGNQIGLAEFGFIVWNHLATKERTLLLDPEGGLLHADSMDLRFSTMDKDRGIYLSYKGADDWSDPKVDILRITPKEFKVLYTDMAIKRTYTADINSVRYLESLICTDPEETVEFYLNENFELKTR